MASIPKIAGGFSCGFLLCMGLSYAYETHPSAELGHTTGRGSQGCQEKVKGKERD